MPNYTYRNDKTGALVELMKPIEERDQVAGHTRLVDAPGGVKVINPSAGGPQSMQVRQVLDGYKRLEERGQLRKTRRQANNIKAAWAMPVVPDPEPAGAITS